MPRRPPRNPAPRRPTATPDAPAAPRADPAPAPAALDPTATAGEWLRRLALGLTAALVAARAYWPAEYHDELNSGDGQGWVAGLLLAAALGVLAAFVGGRLRLRLAWADPAVLILFALVALSARQAAAPRVAYDLAWEWAGVGLAYLLLRNLPRSDGESRALAGVVAATAVALAGYGLYQVAVVQPEMRQLYRESPEATLRAAGIPADNAAARKQFEDRLLGSKEPTATLALTNSLAGVLVGPLVVGLGAALALAIGGAAAGRARTGPIALAAVPGVLLLTCLLLTKSRSAYLGLGVGVAVLGLCAARRVAARRLALGGLALLALVAALAVAGVATGQLDRQVLSESTKSLRYRAEYWAGTWRILWDPTLGGPSTWADGLGPGNFAGPYLRAKLPQASESIADPHDLFLEVWVTAGLSALLALVAALALAGWDLFAPAGWRLAAAAVPEPERRDRDGSRRWTGPGGDPATGTAPGAPADAGPGDGPAPMPAAWLPAAGGFGGVVLALILHPELAGDTWRWLVLAGGWALAVGCGAPLWRRATLPAWALGAGAVAVVVNLLAAGGIGYAPVALGLWGLIALGLNLRADRPCCRARHVGDRPGAVVAAVGWSIVAGSFAGAALPAWQARSALAEAARAQSLARQQYRQALATQPASRSADDRAATAFESAAASYAAATDALRRATRLDRLAVAPWHAWAQLEHEVWRAKGAPTRPDTLAWHPIDSELKQAATPPRDPDDLTTYTLRAQLSADLLNREGWPDFELRRLRADHLDSLRRISRLNPTAAAVHAELALALARAELPAEAATSARRALELDRLTPHADRKLPDATRQRLESSLPRWESPPA